jgi:hypothetical protein
MNNSVATSTLVNSQTTRLAANSETHSQQQSGRTSAQPYSIDKFLALVVQCGLLVFLIQRFNLENPAFRQIMLLAFGGFLIHYFLPLRLRLPFFLLLSFAGIGIVLGLQPAAWLIGLGLLLVGICHLPVGFPARVVALLVAGGILASMRMGQIPVPWSDAIWPILGSMFMFRLIVYMYDLRFNPGPRSISRTLSYFFLLPNVCFPLFPVVDYNTFRRTYYDSERHATYQTGVRWIFRGLTHLIAYRFVYYYLCMDPSKVMDLGDLIQYLISGFLLYLRISGQFHIIVGMLHLFGFNLPETNHRYLLASSFTDFWRRINIYWKDFMLKVFYYPVFFRLRRFGPTTAMVLTTLLVFVVTWLLHSYQWLWLRGSILLSSTDALFWATLAILVTGNAVYESYYGRVRAAARTKWSLGSSTALVLRTAATCACICILWSLWNSESVSEWLYLMSRAANVQFADKRLLVALLIGAVGFSGAVIFDAYQTRTQLQARLPSFWSTAAITASASFILCIIGVPSVYSRFGPVVATVMQNLQASKLNRLDAGLLERGYYENLNAVDRYNGQLWEIYRNRPANWLDNQVVSVARSTGDFLQRELVPSSKFYSSGTLVTTNRWGMRDQEYEQQPPAGTYRIALLGASYAMGQGVNDDESFEAITELQMNRQLAGQPFARYEILNFAVSGYKGLQQVAVLENRVFPFSPNAVLYVTYAGESSSMLLYLAETVRNNVAIPFEFLTDIVRKAGIDNRMGESEAVRRLRPFQQQIAEWMYQRMADDCRKRNIQPVWACLVMPGNEKDNPDFLNLRQHAENAGFTILDLTDCYGNQPPETLSIAEWDNHPNKLAHQLIAQRLLEELKTKVLSRAKNSAANGPTNDNGKTN